MAPVDPSRGWPRRNRGVHEDHQGLTPACPIGGRGVFRTWAASPDEAAWRMAAVEALRSADPLDATQWLVIRGTLRESDLPPLLEGTTAPTGGNVTLDLCNLEDLTPGGCWTIRNLGEDLWSRGLCLTVVYGGGGAVADVLRSTGTVGHRRIFFQESPIDTHRQYLEP
jgi:hypothetical protein